MAPCGGHQGHQGRVVGGALIIGHGQPCFGLQQVLVDLLVQRARGAVVHLAHGFGHGGRQLQRLITVCEPLVGAFHERQCGFEFTFCGGGVTHHFMRQHGHPLAEHALASAHVDQRGRAVLRVNDQLQAHPRTGTEQRHQ